MSRQRYPLGLALANLAVLAFSQLSGDQFLTWGWRVPFLLSIVMVAIGIYIQLGIMETPVFTRIVNEERIERAPSLEIIKRRPKQVILAAFARMGEQASGYIYIAHYLHLWHSGAGNFARFPAPWGADDSNPGSSATPDLSECGNGLQRRYPGLSRALEGAPVWLIVAPLFCFPHVSPHFHLTRIPLRRYAILVPSRADE